MIGKKITALLLVFAGIGILSVFSCKDRLSSYTLNYQYSYYPLDSGHYVDYIVDSITYSNAEDGSPTIHDTSIYLLRMVIGDTFYDNLNQLNYQLVLYTRPDSNSQWSFYKKWFAARTTTNNSTPYLAVTETDLKFVKLVFPPQVNETWNGNEYLPNGLIENSPGSTPYDIFENWNYYYTNIDTTVTINGLTLPHAIVVSEVNNVNLVSDVVRLEVYVPNVGLVYQAWEGLTKQNVLTDWNTGPENGFRIRWSVIGHYP